MKLIAWESCAQHTADAATRTLHPILVSGGWPAYAEQVIAPQLRWLSANGFSRRIVLQNPWGYVPAEGFYLLHQLDLASQLKLLAADTTAMRRALRPCIKDGAEIILYLGTFSLTGRGGAPINVGAADDWIRWLMRPVLVALDCGCSIGWDASNTYAPASAAYELLQLTAAVMRQTRNADACYVESRPARATPELWTLPSITQDNFWRFMESQIRVQGTAHWAAHRSELSGEIVRWVQWPAAIAGSDGSPWNGPNVAERLSQAAGPALIDGDTAAISIGTLAAAGLTRADVEREARLDRPNTEEH